MVAQETIIMWILAYDFILLFTFIITARSSKNIMAVGAFMVLVMALFLPILVFVLGG